MGQDGEEDERYLLAQAAIVIAIAWACGRLAGFFNATLVGEIVAGMVLGADVLAIAPYEDALLLLGRVGLVIIVMEGGLSIDINKLPQLAGKATAIAVLGTALPVALGYGTVIALGTGALEAIAAGAALSSTSIGMASKMLQQLGEQNTLLGNLIAVSAMIDDILSLIILAVLQQLESNDDSGDETAADRAWLYLKPIVVSIAFLLAGAILVIFLPQWHRLTAARYPQLKTSSALVIALLTTTALLTIAAAYAGTTFLLGAFIAGMMFSEIEGATAAIQRHVSLTEWLSTIFFVSVGLVVPVKELFSPLGIAYGLLYTVPAFLGKYVTGVLAPSGERAIVGCAMIGRGELGFIMAQESFESGLISELTFATCVWGLLLCTLVSPLLLRWRLVKKRQSDALADNGAQLFHEIEARHITIPSPSTLRSPSPSAHSGSQNTTLL